VERRSERQQFVLTPSKWVISFHGTLTSKVTGQGIAGSLISFHGSGAFCVALTRYAGQRRERGGGREQRSRGLTGQRERQLCRLTLPQIPKRVCPCGCAPVFPPLASPAQGHRLAAG
jgi:hypothetical protein